MSIIKKEEINEKKNKKWEELGRMALFLLVTRFLSCFIDLVITSCLNKGRQDNVIWDINTVVF